MAKRKKQKPPASPHPDQDDAMGPTPERRRQFGDKASKFRTDTGRVIDRLSVVDSLYENDEIGPDGFLAAAHYLADYDVGFNTRMTANLSNDVVDGSGSADHYNAKRMDAAKRFTEASQSLDAPLRHVLRHIVLGDLSMTQYAVQHMGYHPKHSSASTKAKALLIKAINRLAHHYRPVTSAPKPRMQGYMADGARPIIHPFQQDDAA